MTFAHDTWKQNPVLRWAAGYGRTPTTSAPYRQTFASALRNASSGITYACSKVCSVNFQGPGQGTWIHPWTISPVAKNFQGFTCFGIIEKFMWWTHP